MTFQCTHESCFPDTTCALGHIKREECEHWHRQAKDEEESAKQPDAVPSDIPWNGYSLGTSDLAILSGRGSPLLIGLVGLEESGKTSLLSFAYMWLLNHGNMGGRPFAGSWTLGGWESIVQHCRWTVPPPSFPPHTSSNGRHPGILHVTLRHPTLNTIQDILFTDAPGEWFTQWSRKPSDSTAAGARWVIEHSDVLILLIDSQALADPKKLPQARRATRDLIERTGANYTKRPLQVVWTKNDVAVPNEVRSGVVRACSQFLPNAKTYMTTVSAPKTIEQCFVSAIVDAENYISVFDTREPRYSNDPFLAFRENHVNS